MKPQLEWMKKTPEKPKKNTEEIDLPNRPQNYYEKTPLLGHRVGKCGLNKAGRMPDSVAVTRHAKIGR